MKKPTGKEQNLADIEKIKKRMPNRHPRRNAYDGVLLASSSKHMSTRTMIRISALADMIVAGASQKTIEKYCKDAYKVGDQQARNYYCATLQYLMPEDIDEHRRQLLEVNMHRLEQIIERSMKDDRDLKLAKDTIMDLSKLIGATSGNLVQINKDNQGNEQINIQFGE